MSSKPKQKRGTKPQLTELQTRAVALFRENMYAEKPKPLYALLEEAGYAPESARQWTNIWAGIKQHVEPIVQEMEEHREQVLAMMREKIGQATYGELVRSLDVTTRNIRLLTNKSTHNFALDASHRLRIEQLIEE